MAVFSSSLCGSALVSVNPGAGVESLGFLVRFLDRLRRLPPLPAGRVLGGGLLCPGLNPIFCM